MQRSIICVNAKKGEKVFFVSSNRHNGIFCIAPIGFYQRSKYIREMKRKLLIKVFSFYSMDPGGSLGYILFLPIICMKTCKFEEPRVINSFQSIFLRTRANVLSWLNGITKTGSHLYKIIWLPRQTQTGLRAKFADVQATPGGRFKNC